MKLNYEDRKEARAEYIANFLDDATDELLAEEGNAGWLLQDNEACDKALQEVLNLNSTTPLNVRVQLLRDALRAEAWKRWDDEIKVRAERLADDSTVRGIVSVPFASLNDSKLAAICPVPEFPSLRGEA